MGDMSAGPVSSLAVSPDGALVATATADGNLSIRPLDTPTAGGAFHSLAQTTQITASCPPISALCFPGQNTVYTATSSGSFARYNVHACDSPPVEAYRISDAHGSSGELTGIAAVSATSAIVTCGKDGLVRCWDSETKHAIARLSGHKYEVRAVAVATSSADDAGEPVNVVASAGRDKTVRLWDVRASESNAIHVFSGHTGWVHDVAISGGGAARPHPAVVSCAGDKTVRLWNLAMMKQEAVFTGHEYRVWGVCVASDSTFALSGSTDATVRAWNLCDTGADADNCVVLEGHRDSVISVAVSRDGTAGVSGCEDGSVYVWDTSTLFGRTPPTREECEAVDLSNGNGEAAAENDKPLIDFNDDVAETEVHAISETSTELVAPVDTNGVVLQSAEQMSPPTHVQSDAIPETSVDHGKTDDLTSVDDTALFDVDSSDNAKRSPLSATEAVESSFSPASITVQQDVPQSPQTMLSANEGWMHVRSPTTRQDAGEDEPVQKSQNDLLEAAERQSSVKDAEIKLLQQRLQAAEKLALDANARAIASSFEADSLSEPKVQDSVVEATAQSPPKPGGALTSEMSLPEENSEVAAHPGLSKSDFETDFEDREVHASEANQSQEHMSQSDSEAPDHTPLTVETSTYSERGSEAETTAEAEIGEKTKSSILERPRTKSDEIEQSGADETNKKKTLKVMGDTASYGQTPTDVLKSVNDRLRAMSRRLDGMLASIEK